MPISYQIVQKVYGLLLGREPENELAVKQKLKKHRNTFELVKAVIESDEFNSKECVHRLSQRPNDKNSIVVAYKLLLGRAPENDNVVKEKILKHGNIGSLLNGMISSPEYHERAKLIKKDESKKNDINYIVDDCTFNQSPRIIYLHIPKTAGSSFHRLASANLEGSVSLSMPSNIDYDKWIHSKLVGGHYFYSHYKAMKANRLFLSVVRDPVDRAFSLFNYYKHAKDGMEDIRKKMGFNSDSLRLTIEQSSPDFRGEFVNNCQCLYLSGKREFSAFQNVLNRDYFVIGTLENIDIWLQYLGERLGWTSLTLPKVNVSQRSSYMKEMKADKELVKLVSELNKEDAKLFEFIKNAGMFTNCTEDFDFEKLGIKPS